jgi:hypothetical protein
MSADSGTTKMMTKEDQSMKWFDTGVRLSAAMVAAFGLAMAVQASQAPQTFALNDFTGNGDAEAAHFIDDPTQSMGRGLILVVDTGTLGPAGTYRILTPPGTLVDGGVVSDQAGDGRDDVIVLRQQSQNPAVLEAYDPQSGKISRRVGLPKGYQAVSLDTANNTACILTTQTSANNRPRLFNIDVSTKAQISKPALSKNFTALKTVIGSGGGVDDSCLVLLARNSDGKGSVQVWDIATGLKMNSIPIPTGQDPVDVAAVRSPFVPFVVTLALRQSDSRGRLMANDIQTGTTQWAYALPAGPEPVRVIAYQDAQGAERIAALANGASALTQGPVVTILDAATGVLVNTIEYNAFHFGVDLSFPPPTSMDPGTNPELAVTCVFGERRLRDSVTGNWIGNLGG